MKYWEIIADNLSEPVGVGAGSQRLIPTGERSGLQTHIATTESVSLCTRMKSCLRFWNSNARLDALLRCGVDSGVDAAESADEFAQGFFCVHDFDAVCPNTQFAPAAL
jgi:hypothetical protein